jgi:hypothetical protein
MALIYEVGDRFSGLPGLPRKLISPIPDHVLKPCSVLKLDENLKHRLSSDSFCEAAFLYSEFAAPLQLKEHHQ